MMNSAQWHLVTNHLPITGTLFSTIILLVGMLLKNQTIKNTALGLFILTSLFAIPSLLTGEGAEDVLESIGQKNEHFIHQHEELAEKAFWISELTGLLSIVFLIAWQRQKKNIKGLLVLILLSGIINTFLMTWVGKTGGEIRHTEIRLAD